MKKFLQSALALSMTAVISAGMVNAQQSEPCYPTEVLEFNQGLKTNGNAVDANRSDSTQALGQPDASNAVGGFVSLGVNGSITLGFNNQVLDLPGADLLVYETSFSGNNCGNNDDESALIELSNGGAFISVGIICRDGEIDIADSGLPFITLIRITSTNTNTPDGYDVDGVVAINGCTPPFIEEGCFASEVLSYIPGLKDNGQPITDANRIDPTKALGAPQLDKTLNFVSLGYAGELILGFSGVALNGPGDDIRVAETTFGNTNFSNYPESAEVLVTQDGVNYFSVGSLTTNEYKAFDIDAAGQGFTYITAVKIVDTTPEGSVSEDAFDVDGVEALNGCGNIPFIETGECGATQVVSYVQGTSKNGGAIAANRTDETQALGVPEGTDENVFVTLGYGGSLILGFNGSVANLPGDDITVVETSFNTTGCEAYREYADIYVSQDGFNYYFVETVCKSNNSIDISDADFEGELAFVNFVKIVNNDELTTTPDAFDVDGVLAIVNCQIESIPAVTGAELVAFPNPTTGPVVLEFHVPSSQRATLEVMDMNGRTIATLFNQIAESGITYRNDFNGMSLPNGVYMTKLTTVTEVIVTKVMIAR